MRPVTALHAFSSTGELVYLLFVEAFCAISSCARPRSLDDSLARTDWGWKPRYDLTAMTRDMISKLQQQQASKAGPAGKTKQYATL
jgi:nucleoside-diphosphate-sugar epimerase